MTIAAPEDLRAAAVNAVIAAAAFAGVGACIKAASASMPNEVVVFFRNAVALLLLLPWILRVRLAGLRTRHMSGHLLRAGFGLSAMYCFFYALHHLHLAEAVLLNYSAPLFIPLIAWLWIRETPPLIIIPVTLLGLTGIALIVKPGTAGLLAWPAAIGILSGVLAAAAMVSIRRISKTESTPRIVFYFSLFSTLISAVPLLWTWTTPDMPTMSIMIAAGMLALLGQLCLTRAYSLAPAARVGAMTYTSVIFAAGLGWLFWSEAPDGFSIVGAAVVVAACVLATWQQARKPAG
jgi:drug/metabolite transporter (DMT)-like permease